VTTGGGGSPSSVEFVFDGWEVIEEYGGVEGLTRRFVHGVSDLEPIRLENLVFFSNPGTYYIHQDAGLNCVAMSDGAGAAVERVRYSPFAE